VITSSPNPLASGIPASTYYLVVQASDGQLVHGTDIWLLVKISSCLNFNFRHLTWVQEITIGYLNSQWTRIVVSHVFSFFLLQKKDVRIALKFSYFFLLPERRWSKKLFSFICWPLNMKSKLYQVPFAFGETIVYCYRFVFPSHFRLAPGATIRGEGTGGNIPPTPHKGHFC